MMIYETWGFSTAFVFSSVFLVVSCTAWEHVGSSPRNHYNQVPLEQRYGRSTSHRLRADSSANQRDALMRNIYGIARSNLALGNLGESDEEGEEVFNLGGVSNTLQMAQAVKRNQGRPSAPSTCSLFAQKCWATNHRFCRVHRRRIQGDNFQHLCVVEVDCHYNETTIQGAALCFGLRNAFPYPENGNDDLTYYFKVKLYDSTGMSFLDTDLSGLRAEAMNQTIQLIESETATKDS